MIFLRVFKYLKYIVLSESRYGHGIHSPFVFDLVTRVFRNKPDPAVVNNIEKIRKKLISDDRIIKVRDLGSGSGKVKSDRRRVSQIARYSPVSKKYGVLLANMAFEFGKPFILEMGTSLGISTLYLAVNNRDTCIKTIEGCPEIAGIAQENFKKSGIYNIELLSGSFHEILPLALCGGESPGLVFIDGNHRKEPVMEYFTLIAENCNQGTVIIIDDINYSDEMEETWKEIKKYEKVTLTIDIFRMGIVFFRTGISHKDYIIRY